MKMTATQKILASHAGLDNVKTGMLIETGLDMVLGNDVTAPVAINEFNKINATGIYNKTKIALVMDHFTPNKDIKSAENCKQVREFAKKFNIANFFDVGDMGIEHALLPEKGLVISGDVVIGADSHTCTYGALGAFSTGVGSTDMAYGMITGKTWFKVPSALKVILKGKLNKYVTGKDIILDFIGKIGVDGALYKSLEFCGEGVKDLSMDDRFTIANMAIECGAKNAFFPVDDKTLEYIKGRTDREPQIFEPDEDAEYDEVFEIDLSTLQPTVALPHLPSNTCCARKSNNLEIDQVVIGSCTNGRYSDMEQAAKILEGKKVASGVRLVVIPATQDVYLKCMQSGIAQIFIEAGGIFSTPTCGPCLGGHMGVLASGERAVSTTNRNFVGRMGHPKSEVILSSPYVAAASALTGKITDPRDL